MIGLLPLWGAAALFLIAVMSAAWLVQRRTGQGGWADVFWSFGLGLAGVGVALFPVSGAAPSARQWLVAALIGLWSLRLGLHIARRAAGEAEDARYARLRAEWGDRFQTKMFGFLMLQAGAAAFLTLSLLAAARNPAAGPSLQDGIAALVFLSAVIGEAVADRQLAAFKADPANRGRVCDIGLWGWSRHPNYFFEWLGWCAWPVFAIDLDGSWTFGWLALSGPAYIYWLLTEVSGAPLLEAHMRRSRPQAFAAYARRTSRFFPRPPKP
ncbi:steroid 5-alpha reductase family enzyme [Brevundimonas faecalis]|uniref:Steroid 5-alpha reductase family enzyme n=2 Tax=Brevundimonas faecalis TaxID=947378 RepID=A0ABV2R7Y1_9CAUL